MNLNNSKALKLLICILVILSLCGYYTSPILAAAKQPDLEKKLQMYITENEHTTAGLAAIIIHESETIQEMAGYANIEAQLPVNENTIFEWGSVAKILIWISVLQLAEDGKLDLEKDIGHYLPHDFNAKTSFDKPITIQHLMNHTAGFDDSYTDLMIRPPAKKASLREVLEAADIKQVFSPGESVAYSNYGAALAAYIVEEVSGLEYAEYVRKHIFNPLDMTKTAIDLQQQDHSWVKTQRKNVQGYTSNLQLIEPNEYVFPMYPAGSVMGVADDLQKLLRALLTEDGRPLFKQQTTIDFLFQPSLYYPETDLPRIANGLFFLPSASGQVFGHGGNSIAFSASFYIDRQQRLGVAVLTNMANESIFTLGVPEMTYGEYTHKGNEKKLENSAKWKGIYEPARVPHHGFSKVYGLFLRSQAKQAGSHDLAANGLYYSQAEPGIYTTEDDFSAYAVDIYSEHPTAKKILSSANTDSLYIPYYKHILEWGGIVLAGLAIMLSFIFIIISMVKKIGKKPQSILLICQHVLNILLFMNIMWIINETLSMTSYDALKPFLTANMFYMIISGILSGFMIYQMTKHKSGTLIKILTLSCTIILCVNILYWAFYY